MRQDSTKLESDRLEGLTLDNYPWIHERHRIFPNIFENRNHKKILDVSAGIGVIAKKILDTYPAVLTCNDIDSTCLNELRKLNVNLTCFDLDSAQFYPFTDGSFDAIICLATLEHLIHVDNCVKELKRILHDMGRLYVSVPNYASLYWMIPLLKGKTFHDPFNDRSRYEFYAHIRYFTYHTLLQFMIHFGFHVDTVYLPLPQGSTKFREIKQRSKLLASLIQNSLRLLYFISPRWHQEPVICFAKNNYNETIRKVIL